MGDDAEARLPAPKVRDRLLLALVQKRVLDVLQPKGNSTGWRFQMGLLSSFESFGQTLDRGEERDKNDRPSHEGEASLEGRTVAEREAHALDPLIESYQQTFGAPMPHPKLEAVAKALAVQAWERGEKALVFVRRVRTTEELATQVTWHYDRRLACWINDELPMRLRPAWADVWSAFDRYRTHLRRPANAAAGSQPRSLFGWYFRQHDASEPHEAVGGELARGGLDASRPWSVLLDDNPVLVLHDHDEQKVRRWAKQRREALLDRVLDYVFINPLDGSLVAKRERGASAWFSAFQAAALDLLASEWGVDSRRGHLAQTLRTLRYPTARRKDIDIRSVAPHGDPAQWLVLPTLFAELERAEHSALRAELWGDHDLSRLLTPPPDGTAESPSVEAVLRERDERMAVIAQLLRSGRSYLDLWLAVVEVQQGLASDKVRLNYDAPPKGSDPTFVRKVIHPKLRRLTDALVRRLQLGRPHLSTPDTIDRPGQPLSAWLELARVRRHFKTLRALNFPRLEDVDAGRGRQLLRTTLTGLEPAIALHGSSKTERALEQFRMPGFPVVLVATGVVQEGVDLHTFCRKVVHYGIDGSATGTEQRNGRVDRRGSLIARLLQADPSQTIDVYFPHLRESLEPLQMAALFKKMNRFLIMANDLGADVVSEQQDVLCAIEQQFDQPRDYPAPYTELLTTAFPAHAPAESRCGPLAPPADSLASVPALRLETKTEGVAFSPLVREGASMRWHLTATLKATRRTQPMILELDSGLDPGQATLIVESPVWPFDLPQRAVSGARSAEPSLAGLDLLLTNWRRPAGMHLLTRRRSRTRLNLYLRSMVPLPTNLDDAAVQTLTRWVGRVAKVADELEQDIACALAHDDQGGPKGALADHHREAF